MNINSIIRKMNDDFYHILQSSKKELLNTTNPRLIIDGVVNFWNLKKKQIVFLMNNYYNNIKNSLIFIGVSTMDVGSGEAIPFLMSGKRLIYEENICSRINIFNVPGINESELKKELIEVIDDECKIIEEYGDYVAVIPLRFYSNGLTNDKIVPIISKFILFLFDDKFCSKSDMEKHLKSIEDIEKSINHEKFKMIKFYDNDSEDTIETKINKYFESVGCMKQAPFINSVFEKFYYMCFSILYQALDIFDLCLKNNISPYLRYRIALSNFIIFADYFFNVTNNINIKYMMWNAFYSNLLYQSYDWILYKSRFDKSRFYDSIYSFGSYFWKHIENTGDDHYSLNFKDAKDTVDMFLKDKFNN